VVYGVPAIAVAVEKGAEAVATPSSGPVTTMHIAPWDLTVDTGDAVHPTASLVQEALEVARSFYDDAVELDLRVTMRLPPGAGMGSSAALAVAVLRAMDDARGLTRGSQELVARSYEWEKVFHGTPGGIDNTMAVYGGIARYSKADGLKPILPGGRLCFLVGDSGEQRVGKRMLDIVRRQVEHEPERMRADFESIAAIVGNGQVAIEQCNRSDLGQLMNHNQMLLARMLLSTAELESMIKAARDAGAYGAKLTGAGGGGCMIALVDDDSKPQVKAALEGLGKNVYEVEIGS